MLCISAKFGLIPLIVIVGFARQFCFHYDALGAQCRAKTPIATCDERCKPSRLINTLSSSFERLIVTLKKKYV